MKNTIKAVVTLFLLLVAAGNASAANLTDKEQLGKNLFFDISLSSPPGQSCAACHSPGAGFNGIGDGNIAVYEGAVAGRFGNRNPPAAAYASFSPSPYINEAGLWIGGQFWDGRASTLADQAKGPFLNPVEQNNPSKAAVVQKVAISSYVDLFIKVYGADTLNNVEEAYDAIADAIAAYERSPEVNKFTSKYDWYLKDPAKYPLTKEESAGLKLFNTKGKCAACHPSVRGADGTNPLFTDFSYDNLGVPKVSAATVSPDLGLGAVVGDPLQNGKFKVPTLRNVGVSPPYSHNGYFKTLKEIVHFYNTRDIRGGGHDQNWPPPEVAENVNTTELGDLKLSEAQEDAIVAFLMALTDGYAPPNAR